MKSFTTKYRALIITTIIFAAIYSLISLVNHYNFRTYALDLGAYTNALYDYTHFQWNDSTAFLQEPENLLADHFDIYLIIFSPLSLIFKTYTLLVVQITFLLIGGWGVFKYFDAQETSRRFALPAAIYFYTFFGVYGAVSFDYHSNVIAAMLVPWLLYHIRGRRLITSAILLFVIILAKENVSLWAGFISLGLLWEYRKDKLLRNFLAFSALGCFIFFVMVTSIVMPAIATSNEYAHFDYSILGSGFKEAIIHLLSHPIDSIQTMFVNHTGDPFGDYVKLELHLILIFSGLPLLFWKPQYLLMLIPIYFQKLFHDNYSMWGVSDQYSIEFASILAIGAFSVIRDFKKPKISTIVMYTTLVLGLASAIRIMDNPTAYIDKTRIRIYKEAHYTKDYNVKEVHQALDNIPKDAIISSQSQFVPHLALRDHIYHFPEIKNADFVVFSAKEGTYPMDPKEFDLFTDELKVSAEWEIEYDDHALVILKRKV